MELFTVDTAGDKHLFNASHFETTDTEYFARDFTVKNSEEINRSDGDEDDDDENDDEDGYDYGGKSVDIQNLFHWFTD